MTSRTLSRRRVLRSGIGVAVSLPWLEAMGPVQAWGETGKASQTPNRLAVLYVPNGKNMADWTPATEGTDFELPTILEPLTPVKDQLLVLSGLTADKARPHGDAGGDHARALSAFLTGAQARKTDGTDIRVGISMDQVAASRIGHQTRLPSLEIGCEAGKLAGGCDSGYSCVYSSTMAWRSATQPLPKEVNPKLVFERLFSTVPDDVRVRRNARSKSILDFIREDSRDLSRQLAAGDVRKLDEYFSSIRDIELRIERSEKLPPVTVPEVPQPEGIPASYEEHIRLMADLLVLAFQSDVTRVCTFVLANEGSNRSYPTVGVSDGHHWLSHHGGEEEKLDKIRRINTFHTRQLAYLLEKLKSVPEGDGNLLDHAMVAYGSGNSDGDRHNHNDLPIVLAGGGCGTLQAGRHVRYAEETPLNNLWVSMLNRIEVDVETLGDSSGALPNLG